MPQKKFDRGLLLSALAITAVIFFSGFFIGYNFNNEKLSAVEQDISSVSRDIQNFQIQFLLFDVLGEGSACTMLSSTLTDINSRSDSIGRRLEQINTDTEMTDVASYTDLKKEYSRVLMAYWLLANKYKSSCNQTVSSIVYFYSKECPTCGDQGFVLTYLKKKEGDSLLVFALDGNLNEPGVETIREYYNVTIYPTLVVNGKVFEGFQSTEILENELGDGI